MDIALSDPQITFMFSLSYSENIVNNAIYYLILSTLKENMYDR